MLSFLYISFLVFIIYRECSRKKSFRFDIESFFHLYMCVEYILPPIFFRLTDYNIDLSLWTYLSRDSRSASSYIVFFIILIAYITVMLGLHYGQRVVVVKKLFLRIANDKIAFKALCLCGLAFAGCVLLYSFQYGGLLEFWRQGYSIRGGFLQVGLFSYFYYFASGIVYIPMFFFAYACKSLDSRIRYLSFFCLVIFLIFHILWALSTGGRGSIGMILIPLFLTWVNMTKKKLFWILAWGLGLALVCICIILFGKEIIVEVENRSGNFVQSVFDSSTKTTFLKISSATDLIATILGRFDHRFATLYPVIFLPEIYESPRFLFDFPREIIGLLPNMEAPSIFGKSLNPSGLNEIYFSSLAPKDKGYVPCGWISIGLMNGGILLLLIWSFIGGALGGIFQRLLSQDHNNPFVLPSLVFLMMTWYSFLLPQEAGEIIHAMYLPIYLLLFKSVLKVKLHKMQSVNF